MAERRSSFRGEAVTVLPVVATSSAPVPPGIIAWPPPGSIAVSPGMADAPADPALRAEFPQPVAAVSTVTPLVAATALLCALLAVPVLAAAVPHLTARAL